MTPQRTDPSPNTARTALDACQPASLTARVDAGNATLQLPGPYDAQADELTWSVKDAFDRCERLAAVIEGDAGATEGLPANDADQAAAVPGTHENERPCRNAPQHIAPASQVAPTATATTAAPCTALTPTCVAGLCQGRQTGACHAFRHDQPLT